MTFVPIPGVVRIEFTSRLDNVVVQHAQYLERLGPPYNTFDLTNLAIGGGFWFRAAILPHLSEDVEYLITNVRPQDSEGAGGASAGGFHTRGGIASESLPNNVAYRIEAETGISGRNYRGRLYTYGVPRSVVTNNTVDEAWAIGLLGGWATLIDSFPVGGWRWGVASKFTGGVPRETGIITPVTNVSYANLRVDSRRRRIGPQDT